MPAAAHFLGTRCLGTSTIEDSYNAVRSLAYFCPVCGEIWYRIAVTLDDGRPATWWPEYVPCIKHQPTGAYDWSKIPGTITDAFPTSFQLSRMWWGRAVENLPPAALKHEFQTLLNYYLKDLP